MKIFDATHQPARYQADGYRPPTGSPSSTDGQFDYVYESRWPLGVDGRVHVVSPFAVDVDPKLGDDLELVNQSKLDYAVDFALKSGALLTLNFHESTIGTITKRSTAANPVTDRDRERSIDHAMSIIELVRNAPGGSAIRVGHYGCVSLRHDHDQDGDVEARHARLLYSRDSAGQFTDQSFNDAVDYYTITTKIDGPINPETWPAEKQRRVDQVKMMADLTDKALYIWAWDGNVPANAPYMVELVNEMAAAARVEGTIVWARPFDPAPEWQQQLGKS